MVIKQPGSTRQLLISARGGTGRNYRVKYSRVLGFTDNPRVAGVITGTIGSQSCPSSADEFILLGGGAIASANSNSDDSSASGSGDQPFTPDNTYVYHILIQTVAPYGFLFVANPTIAQGTNRGLIAFMLYYVTVGNPLDIDPYVHYWRAKALEELSLPAFVRRPQVQALAII